MITISAIAAVSTATCVLLGTSILQHISDLAKDHVVSIQITVYPGHGVLRRAYVSKPADEIPLAPDDVAFLVRKLMRFPSSVSITIHRKSDAG